MPTYDYECTKCGHNFEISQGMNDERIKACPKCKGKVKRLIGSGSGIIFKGSGFYATEYRKSANPGGTPCQVKNGEGACKSCPQRKKEE